MASPVGRPRSSTADEKVLTVTADLLQERGLSRLKIDEIAARAGVAKTTIYRRWPSLMRLAVAAYAHLVGDRNPGLTGEFEADVETLLAAAFRVFEVGRGAAFDIGIDMGRQHDAALQAQYRRTMIDPIRDAAIEVVARGQAAGAFRPVADPAALVDAWLGIVLYRRAILGEPVDFETARRLAWSLLGRPAPVV